MVAVGICAHDILHINKIANISMCHGWSSDRKDDNFCVKPFK